MIKISYWAKNHVWQSRLLIILIYILLNALGIFTGRLLHELDISIPEIYMILCIIFTTALFLGYPARQNAKPGVTHSAKYIRRKLFDFSLGAVTFLMIIYAADNREHLFIKGEPAQASFIIHHSKDSAFYNSPLIRNFIATIKSVDISKLSQREKLRLIKQQVKAIKHNRETSSGEKTLLIILSVIIALALLFGLAAVSCSVACSGSEALAAIIGVAGTVLIVYLLVRLIRHISHPSQKKKDEARDHQ